MATRPSEVFTKNTPTRAEASWEKALARFGDWQRMRGMAEKTRRAYRSDLAQLGNWAAGRGLGPRELGHRELRRFAAVLGENGAARSTVARKLAAVRSFYRQLVERGEVDANPADLVSSPKKDAYLPNVLKPEEVAALLERIPATTPLDLRDRGMFELAYAAGLRAEELVNLDLDSVDPDGEEVRVEGKGGRTRVVPAGEHAWRTLERYTERARPVLDTGDSRGPVSVKERAAALHVRRTPPAQAAGAPARHLAAHPPALLRHPSAGGRRRSAHYPGIARARFDRHDSDLHSGRVETPQAGLYARAPAGLTGKISWRRISRR